MQCNQCGFDNRAGVKFCEECGTELPKPAGMTCENCGFENRPGVRFCEECAHELIQLEKIICPHCRFENRPGIRFCEECGQPLEDIPTPRKLKPQAPSLTQQAPSVQPVIVQVEQTQPKRRTLLWAVGSGLIAMLLCCFTYVLLPPPPASGDTALPEAVVTTWGELVRGREYYKEQDTVIGNVIDAIDVFRPAPNANAKSQPKVENEAIEEEEGLTCSWLLREDCLEKGYEWDSSFFGNGYCTCPEDGESLEQWCAREGGEWVKDEDIKNEEYFCDFDNLLENKPGLTFPDLCHKMNWELCDALGGDYNAYGAQDCTCVEEDETYMDWCLREGGVITKVNYVKPYARCDFDKDSDWFREWCNNDGGKVENVIFEGYSARSCNKEGLDNQPMNLASNCPAPNDLTFKNFKVEDGGWYSFDLINKSSWDVDIFYGDLYKGNGDYWHKYECTIDPIDANRMDCGSAPGETGFGPAVGSGSLTFDADAFGTACSAQIEVPVDYGTVAAPECPVGQSMCAGSCCSTGHCCDWGSGLGCYQSCP